MPFLPLNQQRQSTEGTSVLIIITNIKINIVHAVHKKRSKKTQKKITSYDQ